MPGVRLLAMQLLCFRRSGYSALWEETPVSPLGSGDPSTCACAPQRLLVQVWAGELREGSNALLVHNSWEQGGSYWCCRARAGSSPSQGLALNQDKSPQANLDQSLGSGSLSNTQQGPRVGEPARRAMGPCEPIPTLSCQGSWAAEWWSHSPYPPWGCRDASSHGRGLLPVC